MAFLAKTSIVPNVTYRNISEKYGVEGQWGKALCQCTNCGGNCGDTKCACVCVCKCVCSKCKGCRS